MERDVQNYIENLLKNMDQAFYSIGEKLEPTFAAWMDAVKKVLE